MERITGSILNKRIAAAVLGVASLLLVGCAEKNTDTSKSSPPVRGSEAAAENPAIENPAAANSAAANPAAGSAAANSAAGSAGATRYVWDQSMGKFDAYPDDYFLKWALPCNREMYQFLNVGGPGMEALNAKLEADGYPFGLKFVFYDLGANAAEPDSGALLAGLMECNADIATVYNAETAELAQTEGLFEALGERLAGSALYEAIPELCWEGVRYRDKICYVPSEQLEDGGPQLYVHPGLLPEGFPERFSGNLLDLEDDLSAETPMFYEGGLSFVNTLGYIYDGASGLLITEDGQCVNPLEEEPVTEALRTLNRWYHEGKLRFDHGEEERCALLFSSIFRFLDQQKDWQSYYSWPGYASHRMNMIAGIFSASEKKDAAFTLLELFHSNPDYGNLLIYGKLPEEDQEPEEDSHMLIWALGLDTGLKWRGNWNSSLFSNKEEKKRYYEENILPSPALYMDFPKECRRLQEIEERYLVPEQTGKGKIRPETSILTCDDFDAKLQEFHDKLKEPADDVLKKMAQQ